MIVNLADAIQSHINNYKTQMFTSLPAKVTSYNSKEQTISARPVMNEPFKDGEVSEFPEIDYIPVIFTGAGGGVLTFPIQVGDEVLLTFSSRSFDTWWTTGETQKLSTTQRYNDITDAVAIIGLTSKDKSVKANTEDVELKYNGNTILLKKDGTLEAVTTSTLNITNDSEELITVLSDALQALADVTTNTIYGVSPINNRIDVLAIKSRLDTFKK